MTVDDVIAIRQAGRRARALEAIIQMTLERDGLRVTATLARKELEELRTEIYQKYDIRL